ncbi:MAG: hypothetical protein P4L46_24535 [Fimbriimonas sp.]|nr:hypothetical protein [Fimbriimonas sp.]
MARTWFDVNVWSHPNRRIRSQAQASNIVTVFPLMLLLALPIPVAGQMPDALWVSGKSCYVIEGKPGRTMAVSRFVESDGTLIRRGSPIRIPNTVTGCGPGRNDSLLIVTAAPKGGRRISRVTPERISKICDFRPGSLLGDPYCIVSETEAHLTVQTRRYGGDDPIVSEWIYGNSWIGPVEEDLQRVRFPVQADRFVTIDRWFNSADQTFTFSITRQVPRRHTYSYFWIRGSWLKIPNHQQPYQIDPLPSFSDNLVALYVRDSDKRWLAVIHMTDQWSKTQAMDVWQETGGNLLAPINDWQPMVLDSKGRLWVMPAGKGFQKVGLTKMRTVIADDY